MTPQTLTPPPPNIRKPPNFILLLVAGIIGAYVIFNGVMLMFAMESPPSLVSPSYYEDARGFDSVQNAQRASDAAGWQVEAQPVSANTVAIYLKDRADRAVSGFNGAASAYRPNDPSLDQPLTWQEDPGQPGRYLATFARPKAGQWQIQLDLRRGGERVNHQLRIATH